MQILSTKLSVPPLRSGLVERSRLIQKLNQEIGCGFVLVTAPAGYGKSTLLSSWLNQVDLAAAWLSLDERDNDISRFLVYLSAAFHSIDPSSDDAPTLTLKPGPEPEIDESLTLFINHLAQIKHTFCLVLDDYHLIKNQAIHQAVTFLVEHAPSSLCLVISTRADPPLPLAKLRARKKMLELRQSDLCFTTQEAAAFLNSLGGCATLQGCVHLLHISKQCISQDLRRLHVHIHLKGQSPMSDDMIYCKYAVEAIVRRYGKTA